MGFDCGRLLVWVTVVLRMSKQTAGSPVAGFGRDEGSGSVLTCPKEELRRRFTWQQLEHEAFFQRRAPLTVAWTKGEEVRSELSRMVRRPKRSGWASWRFLRCLLRGGIRGTGGPQLRFGAAHRGHLRCLVGCPLLQGWQRPGPIPGPFGFGPGFGRACDGLCRPLSVL